MVLGSGGPSEPNLRSCEFLVLLARNFVFSKTPSESLLVACDCCLAHPTPSHASHKEFASISWAVVDGAELWLSASQVQTFSWGMFFVSFFLCLLNLEF